jgi:hypothetical protein
MSTTDSINELPFPSAADAALSAKPSEIEREVLDLFEQFRDPLLRYALSFGIPAMTRRKLSRMCSSPSSDISNYADLGKIFMAGSSASLIISC